MPNELPNHLGTSRLVPGFLRFPNDGHAHSAESEYLRALAFDHEATDRFGWLIQASRDGYVQATTDLGIALLEGNGCKPDAGWGLGELERAAGAGNRNAKYVLGLIYDPGDLGVKNDHEKASQLLRASAKDGQPDPKTRVAEGFRDPGNLRTAGGSEPPK